MNPSNLLPDEVLIRCLDTKTGRVVAEAITSREEPQSIPYRPHKDMNVILEIVYPNGAPNGHDKRFVDKLGGNSRMNWQPIETAPKDGTVILVSHIDGICAAILEHAGRSDAYWRVTDGDEVSDLFRVYGDEVEAASIQPKPTHWMPLPEPPK